jgi:uncharacterized protein with ATP-grasp and redox domains
LKTQSSPNIFPRFRECQVYTITEDPFKEVCQKLDSKKAELADLLEQKNLDKSNAHLDESLTYEDLVITLLYMRN